MFYITARPVWKSVITALEFSGREHWPTFVVGWVTWVSDANCERFQFDHLVIEKNAGENTRLASLGKLKSITLKQSASRGTDDLIFKSVTFSIGCFWFFFKYIPSLAQWLFVLMASFFYATLTRRRLLIAVRRRIRLMLIRADQPRQPGLSPPVYQLSRSHWTAVAHQLQAFHEKRLIHSSFCAVLGHYCRKHICKWVTHTHERTHTLRIPKHIFSPL